MEGAADRLADPRVFLYFGYFRFTRMVTVIAKASAIVMVSVYDKHALPPFRPNVDWPARCHRAGRRLGRRKRPSPQHSAEISIEIVRRGGESLRYAL